MASRSRTPPRTRSPKLSSQSPEKERELLDRWQRKAAEVAAGQSLFVTGEAGSGKTHLLGYLRDHLPDEHVSLAAPTWKAASRVGGTSVHFFAGVSVGKLEVSAQSALEFIRSRPEKEKDDVIQRIRRCEVLVLDEVSMLHPAVLDSLEELCRLVRESKAVFGGIRCIFGGDFLQIPPVTKGCRGAPLAFTAKCWEELFPAPGQKHTLCGVHRQEADLEYHGFLNRVRYGYIIPEDLRLLLEMSRREGGSEWLQIYATNKEVEEVNRSRLRRMDGDAVVYDAEDSFAPGFRPTPEVRGALEEQCPRALGLKVGAPVRLTHVRNTACLHRGMEGTVVGFRGGWPLVEMGGSGEVEHVPPRIGASFQAEARGPRLATRRQVPLALGWASTLHKAQGMSLTRAATHVGHVFQPNMGYVALSRVVESKGLRLLDRLHTMTSSNLRAWLLKKLLCVGRAALDFHMAMLPPQRRAQIRREQEGFRRLHESEKAWEAALRGAGFAEGGGVEYHDRRPDWAVSEYGDQCFKCGKRGHWQGDCLE